jgi:large subunit ribosomal protein L21
MQAVVRLGGQQYRVAPGDTVEVDRLSAAEGEQVEIGEVLMTIDHDRVAVGAPLVAGAQVKATVVRHLAGEKLIVFKYKAKKRYRSKQGHRRALTALHIDDVTVPGAASARKSK